ncbi:unnamed protein product [Dovyalis caffra]|uniref:Reverse transcriptase n=1 Tax=Dovyalis caffra TaxID=77055 RepID=A0AAV1RX93_9ROSI|nr:unnamed protein product [Dovyalis caffra]
MAINVDIEEAHDRLGWNFVLNTLRDAGLLDGRITLAKSALLTIPVYTIQSANLSISTCNVLEKQSKWFVWGSIKD